MPGIVSAKTPPPTVSVPDPQIRPGSSSSRAQPPKPSPSPSVSRAKPSPDRSSTSKKIIMDESALDNPDLGPFLLKVARDTIASGDGPNKALDYAIRASKSFERCAALDGDGEPSLDLVMSFHVVAAIYCSLGRFQEAVPVLQRAVTVPDISRGSDHALAAFSGYMQLGDTHSMLGHLDHSIHSYQQGLSIQIQALGDSDPRVAETCRFFLWIL